LGKRAIEVANNMDTRIGRFENLLVGPGRGSHPEIENRAGPPPIFLNSRMEQLSGSIRTNTAMPSARWRSSRLLTTEALRASSNDVERAIESATSASVGTLRTSAADISRLIDSTTSTSIDTLRTTAGDLQRTIDGATTGVG